MTDLLIRNVPEDVLEAIDAKAARLGLSRVEYLRRALDRERANGAVSPEDLSRFRDTFADLLDKRIMSQAWE